MKNTVLVTGGSGFLGLHIIHQLLQQGYIVRTTLRSISKKQAILDTLEKNGTKNLEKLTFFEADLASDDNWAMAMNGCDYVLSVASPVFFTIPDNEEDAIRPAVEGITRILTHAKTSGVKRVVMTSNFGAVGFSQFDKSRQTMEKDWTAVSQKGLSIYEKSKLLAEKAAWDFVNQPDCPFEFTTVNPVAIFGPSFDGHTSGSLTLITNLLNGSMKRIPNLPLNIVDVRDVAALHLLAMQAPQANHQRFIATAPGQISLQEIAQIIKQKRPAIAKNITDKKLATFLIRIAAPFSKQAREAELLMQINRDVSSQHAKTLLDWHSSLSNEAIVLASIDSMISFGAI